MGSGRRTPEEARQIESLKADWDIQDEALDFIHALSRGKTTFEKIRSDVLMTDQQEKLARTEFPTFSRIIRNIKRRRWFTWKAICYGMNWEPGERPQM